MHQPPPAVRPHALGARAHALTPVTLSLSVTRYSVTLSLSDSATQRDVVTSFRFRTVTGLLEARRFDVEILDRLRGPHQRRQVVDHGDLEHLTASGDDRFVPTACLELRAARRSCKAAED